MSAEIEQLGFFDGPPETAQEAAWPVASPETYLEEPEADTVARTPPEKKFYTGRHSPRREARRFDQTALHYSSHSGKISHADYIAHCEKYDYAMRTIVRGDRILDIGCGTDYPLMKGITGSMTHAQLVLAGGGYVGVDLNKVKPTKIAWATLLGEVDATDPAWWPGMIPRVDSTNHWDFGQYTKVVALEIIEHMAEEDGYKLLTTMREALVPLGTILLSTPVFDGKGMARNHVREYTVDELRRLITAVGGLIVQQRMGTFTSEPVLKRWLKANRPDWLALYEESRQFHSAGYMSGLLAPMLPDLSRNNLWVIRKETP